MEPIKNITLDLARDTALKVNDKETEAKYIEINNHTEINLMIMSVLLGYGIILLACLF